MILKQSCIQVYIGDGKGKTTASLGLAFRMAGAGGQVFVVQFMKGRPSSEQQSAEKLSNITIERFGLDTFVHTPPKKEDVAEARRGLERAKSVIATGDYDLVILDEINTAIKLGLLSVSEVLDMLLSRPEYVEVILTGRNAPPEILDVANLITEMRAVRHYYDKGVSARIGIEE
jgi:cob(I)alamin adenosyltransferase